MNIDFTIPATPAAARKLHYAGKIMKLDMDASIMAKATQDLLVEDEVRQKFTGAMNERIGDLHLQLCQYAADHDYRIVLGANEKHNPWLCALAAAMASGEQIVLVAGDNLGISAWDETLKSLGVPYIHYQSEEDLEKIEHVRVVATYASHLNHAFMNKNRHRIAITMINATMRSSRYQHGDGPDIYGNYTPYSVDVVREFPKLIASFYIKHPEQDGDWWENYKVQNLLKATHTGLNIGKVLTTHHHAQNDLMKMGFILRSPNHIAKLLGIDLTFL